MTILEKTIPLHFLAHCISETSYWRHYILGDLLPCIPLPNVCETWRFHASRIELQRFRDTQHPGNYQSHACSRLIPSDLLAFLGETSWYFQEAAHPMHAWEPFGTIGNLPFL